MISGQFDFEDEDFGAVDLHGSGYVGSRGAVCF